MPSITSFQSLENIVTVWKNLRAEVRGEGAAKVVKNQILLIKEQLEKKLNSAFSNDDVFYRQECMNIFDIFQFQKKFRFNDW